MFFLLNMGCPSTFKRSRRKLVGQSPISSGSLKKRLTQPNQSGFILTYQHTVLRANGHFLKVYELNQEITFVAFGQNVKIKTTSIIWEEKLYNLGHMV